MVYHPEQCASLIEKEINSLAIGRKTPHNLYQPIDYVLEAGGKRVRPVLTLLACNLFGGHVEKAIMPAIAIEVFHNFTLLHDDVMDKAGVRRNRPTVHVRWSENTAILSGDAMLTLAYQYLCRTASPRLPEMLEVFNRSALEVCEGQQYDMDFESRDDVSIDEYLNMIRLKTAALIAASLQMGAICGDADEDNTELLYRFGISLGLTFQIQDDWLDAYSDPGIFGKATGGDILTGKKTYLLLTAMEQADNETKKSLLSIINDGQMPADEKIGKVKDIYGRLNVGDIAQEAAEKYYLQAMQYLQNVKISDRLRKTELEKFASELLKRNK